MCSKRSMSFWTASPLSCQPWETGLDRDLDHLWWRSRTQVAAWALCHPLRVPGTAWAITRLGHFPSCGAASPTFNSSFCVCFPLLTPSYGRECTSTGVITVLICHVFSCTNKWWKDLFDQHGRVKLCINVQCPSSRLLPLSSCLLHGPGLCLSVSFFGSFVFWSLLNSGRLFLLIPSFSRTKSTRSMAVRNCGPSGAGAA